MMTQVRYRITRSLCAMAVAAVALASSAFADLPGGYEPIPYLESTGTQWINPDYKLKPGTKIEAEFSHLKYLSRHVLFGGVNWGCGSSLLQMGGPSKITYFRGGTGSSDTVDIAYDYSQGDRFAIVIVNSEEPESVFTNKTAGGASTAFTAKSITAEQDFLIFTTANTTSDRMTTQAGSCRLYSMKLSDGNALKRNLVPVRRLSDRRLGLYDLVDGGFYENANASSADDFRTGGSRLTYIRSNGSQRIVNFYKTTETLQSFRLWFGENTAVKKSAYIGGQAWGTGSFLINQNNAGEMAIYGRTSYATFSSLTVGTGPYYLDFDNQNESGSVFQGGGNTPVSTISKSGLKAAADQNLIVFGMNLKDTTRVPAKFALYRIQTTDPTAGDHDFIPFMDPDGHTGIADVENDCRFFSGTTDGGDVSDFAHGLAYMLVGDTAWFSEGTLTESDMRALDSGAVDYATFKTSGGTLNTAAVASFVKPVRVASGTWSLQDGAVSTQTVPAFALDGGATLAFDIVGAANDTIAVTDSVTLDATADNKIKVVLAVTGLDQGVNGFTLISSGLRSGDEDCFELVDWNGGLSVEDGALVVRIYQAAATAKWIGGDSTDITDMSNWECRDESGNVLALGSITGTTVCRYEGGTPKFDVIAPFACARFVIAGNVTLDGDRDWTGLGDIEIAPGVAIDEGGFQLKLAGNVAGGASSAIRNGTNTQFTVAQADARLADGFALSGVAVLTKAGEGSLTVSNVTLATKPSVSVTDGTLAFRWDGTPPTDPFAGLAFSNGILDLGGAVQTVADWPVADDAADAFLNGTLTTDWNEAGLFTLTVGEGGVWNVNDNLCNNQGKGVQTVNVRDGGILNALKASMVGDWYGTRDMTINIANGGVLNHTNGIMHIGCSGDGIVTIDGGTLNAEGRALSCTKPSTNTSKDKNNGTTTLTLSNGALLKAATISYGNDNDETKKGRFTLTAGGGSTLRIGSLAAVGETADDITFNGATVVPTADGVLFQGKANLANNRITIGANGLVIDNVNEKSIVISETLAGSGTLTLDLHGKDCVITEPLLCKNIRIVNPHKVKLTGDATFAEGTNISLEYTDGNVCSFGLVISWEAAQPDLPTVTLDAATQEKYGNLLVVDAKGVHLSLGLVIILR